MCKPNPCKNGATCLQLGSNGYACQCAPECAGFNCSVCMHQQSTSNKLAGVLAAKTNDASTKIAQVTTKTCRNLNKGFCRKFRELTNCKHDYSYLGTSLKSYCCDLCL